ncbi:hypothetical protein C7974DRAFT_225692 [Boeremia exigua]|uniref:uncharacterized protein n=1 Tax=Boeremia exigua TaxID=749465 RepID=UPI001E8DE8E8|nr:uncharacterized protein C7974DRAFT_225692 [Boeremia exigua]KAH6620071.1 hypothetical protein C7974DRAFT_225692 [Boeremia exigua]
MAPQTILITGAASGLGLAFLLHYASQTPPPFLIAIDTVPFPPDLPKFKRLGFRADVTSPEELYVAQTAVDDEPIGLIIHCAGIRGLVPRVVAEQPGDVAAAETLAVMDRSTFTKTLEVNTWGTFNLVTSFLPSLKMAEDPKVVIMSSRMGSVSANVAGGGYAYRASKAALNAVVKSFAIDIPEVTFLLLHPGRVETGLVEWKEDGAISTQESLSDCLKVIDGLKKEDSGKFVDRFGETIAW